MAKYIHHSVYFYGNEVSDYGKEHKRVDYATLAKSFDAVLNNEIMPQTENAGFYWDLENGDYIYYEDEAGNILSESEYDELSEEEQEKCEQYTNEVMQWYIVSDRGAEILEECTNEIVYYCSALDVYLWGVTHWGTSWNYVLTDIPIE